MAMNDIIGKVVAITANEEIGYGTDGDAIIGVVTKIEPVGTGAIELGFDGLRESGTFKVSSATKTALAVTEDCLATVEWGKTFVDVPTNATAPAVGDYVSVDGAGKIKTIATATNAVVISVDSSTKIAIIKVA